MFLKIALPVPLRGAFDYRYPPGQNAVIGSRVLVPFGRRRLVGVVVGSCESTEVDPKKIRPIEKMIESEAILPDSVLSLLNWAAGYYHHPLGETLFTALPALIRQGKSLYSEPEPRYTLTTLGRELEIRNVKGSVQQKILSILGNSPSPIQSDVLRDLSPSWKPTLSRLIEKHWVKEVLYTPEKTQDAARLIGDLTPNRDQQAAIDALAEAKGFGSFVLHGVTGSGKTEVYIQAARQILDQGRQVLILTPEIGLTPQLTHRVENRLGVDVSVLHSGQNDTERLQAWRKAREGRSRVIIGTRSSIFSPASELGLIIVDEEHDLSYKQQDGLRYNARDLAVMRARMEDIPVVLGSATPSLESYANCLNNKNALLSLPNRAGGAAEPLIQFLDMRKTPSLGGLSPQLLEAIRTQLEKGEQTLLFLNRRGYSPVLYCTDCDWIAPCKRCDARLTYHKQDDRLRCHHCGADFPVFDHCENCRGSNLTSVGEGTERIEEGLAEILPKARLLRIDRDSMSRKHSMTNALEQIQNNQADVLIGTQMLSKGHHFPNVTLVGVINADSALYSTDFRAPERLFQQITQVSGRAGREDKPGRVLIQTHHPEHPAYTDIHRGDYLAFASRELQDRRDMSYPPYRYFALLRAESVKEESALQFLETARELGLVLFEKNGHVDVSLSDAVPSPMQRRAGRWRAQLLAQGSSRADLHSFLSQWLAKLDEQKGQARKVRWSIDVDPMDMG